MSSITKKWCHQVVTPPPRYSPCLVRTRSIKYEFWGFLSSGSDQASYAGALFKAKEEIGEDGTRSIKYEFGGFLSSGSDQASYAGALFKAREEIGEDGWKLESQV